MTERMRALEDALAIAQAAQSSHPHSLLTAEAKQDSDTDFDECVKQETDSNTSEAIVESFGTLHINEEERTIRFFGTSGGSEVCGVSVLSCCHSPKSIEFVNCM
jgi:uncharacterized protein YgbK (DUF1537 family)